MANLVFFTLGFLQVHHLHDVVEHFVQERVLHWVVGLSSRKANRLVSGSQKPIAPVPAIWVSFINSTVKVRLKTFSRLGLPRVDEPLPRRSVLGCSLYGVFTRRLVCFASSTLLSLSHFASWSRFALRFTNAASPYTHTYRDSWLSLLSYS